METVKIKTKDGVIIEAKREVVETSDAIKAALASEINPTPNDPIPVNRVDSTTFRQILSWNEHNIKEPIEIVRGERSFEIPIPPWHEQFFSVDSMSLGK